MFRDLFKALMVLVVGTWVVGCHSGNQSSLVSTTNTTPKEASPHLNRPLPHLATLELWIGKATVKAEVARTPTELATGMMFRTNLPPGQGMLFVFPYPSKQEFWMKNTQVPLSLAYISPEGYILEIHRLKPMDETPVPSKGTNVQFALEVPQGWFEQNGIQPGMLISTPFGPLDQIDWRTLQPRQKDRP